MLNYHLLREGEQESVHVEVEYDHLDGGYGHMTRVCPRIMGIILNNKGWTLNGSWNGNANFIMDWGSGPVVKLRNGEIVEDGREDS